MVLFSLLVLGGWTCVSEGTGTPARGDSAEGTTGAEPNELDDTYDPEDEDEDEDEEQNQPSSRGSGGPIGSGLTPLGTSQYAWYAPECLRGAPDVSVVYTLHGSGGAGDSMVEAWRDLADEHCLLVIGLDSESGASWNFEGDVENFTALYSQVDDLYDVAARYLHGYSAGAHWTYIVGISNSRRFDGLGVYGGSLDYAEAYGYWPDSSEQPIPVAIAHGTADTTIPFSDALHAARELDQAGWPVDLYAVEGGTHTYDPSCEARALAWWMSQR